MHIVNELNFSIETTKSGLSAFCDQIDVYTIGENMEELKENVRRAINLYYQDYPKTPSDSITVKFHKKISEESL